MAGAIIVAGMDGGGMIISETRLCFSNGMCSPHFVLCSMEMVRRKTRGGCSDESNNLN